MLYHKIQYGGVTMNKKKLIILIVLGLNLLFGVIMVLDGILNEEIQWAFAIGMATIIGAAIQLWSFKNAILRKKLFSIVIYAIVVIVLATVIAFNSWPAAIVSAVLYAICAIDAITGLKTNSVDDGNIAQ